MADAWAGAECAIARAGAGNVAEVWANAVPTLFLPYPFHADNHQARNALVLTTPGAARIATDLVDPAKNLATAGPILREVVHTPELRATMRAALRSLGPADGAVRAARIVADLIAPRLDHRRTR
jgi:UDP-N-acetylglucosamine--N-acetylmuramyl-(pentapeptide) pyrophosphoryl-undecaprenol N-acetylglucosamine transferase